VGGTPKVGDMVRNKNNHQVGKLTELRAKKAIVQIGHMPFSVAIDEWVVVRKKEQPKGKKK
jgi:dsDNA-specific endonuclease/ATPase MutS2